MSQLYDPDFDGIARKRSDGSVKGSLEYRSEKHQRVSFRLPGLPVHLSMPSWPIRRFQQVVFAEALKQGLGAGIEADRAIRLAALVNPGQRFRKSLLAMATNLRAGYPLGVSLSKTGVRACPGLLAALEVGEERGGLVEELDAYVRKSRSFSNARFWKAIGRSPEAVQFAAVLARRLRERGLTVQEVLDSGKIAGTGKKRFLSTVEEIAFRMENGESFGGALATQGKYFDAHYCGILEAAESKEELRTSLEVLGGELP